MVKRISTQHGFGLLNWSLRERKIENLKRNNRKYRYKNRRKLKSNIWKRLHSERFSWINISRTRIFELFRE